MKIYLTGASSGIGRATAETLVQRGHEVWGTSREASRVPARERLHPVMLDLEDSGSIERGFRAALAEAGEFDVVINNAGSGHFSPGDSLSADEWRRLFQTLLFGQVQLCQLALEAMRAQGHGLIINVTSLVAELPVPYMAAYNAAKAALASWTMTMQLELGDSPVRFVDLQPADIRTGFNDAIPQTAVRDEKIERIWRVVDRNMKEAPGPEVVGRRIAELIESGAPPPRVIVGGAFQAKIAPVIAQLLPQRLRIWGLKKYYGL